MKLPKTRDIDESLSKEYASNYILSIEKQLESISQQRTHDVTSKLDKVLQAFADERLSVQHFSSLTGYGHGDIGREVIDRIFARVLGADKAAVRLQFVSGTHAISTAFFGVLRPGDNLLSVSGRPYDTLEEVIGIRGEGQGSLRDFGIFYDHILLKENGDIDFDELDRALEIPRTMIFVQRSCGYSWRPSLSIRVIKKICEITHKKQPNCICFVDNCYGEFVESQEPTEVGADLIAGSLIKNLGGTIVPTGGYVAGRAKLVEQACLRLTSPGIGSKGGISFDLNRVLLQGLFLAPQMVSEALIGADLVAATFAQLGFEVLPLPGTYRSDLIQAIRLGHPKALQIVCRSFQKRSPVGSFLEPIPAPMPGYKSNLIMAGGTFIDGSTSELSADAPLRAPFDIFVQGGSHRSHVKIALIEAVADLFQAGFLDLDQNR